MAGVKGRSGRSAEKLDPTIEIPTLGNTEAEVHAALDWAWSMLLTGRVPPRHCDSAIKAAAQKIALIKATKKIDERLDQLESWLGELQRSAARK